jgi:hypothetical protein
VCNGLASVREPNVTTDLIRRRKLTTVAKYRKYALGQELLDLDSTCHAIRESQRKKRTPAWLIVAVDKVDLYFDGIERARDYYSPTSDSPFADRPRALATQVGTDFFRWETAPVCGCLERFVWNREELVPQIDPARRDAYLGQFLRLLESYAL